MKRVLHIVCLIICLLTLTINAAGCSSSSSRESDWQRDAYEAGYYKGADGKWYHK